MKLGMYYLTLKLKITALALELLWDLGNVLFCLLEWIRAMVILNVWEEVVCPIVTFLPAVISLNITRFNLYATATCTILRLPYCVKYSSEFCVLQLSNLRMKGIQIIAEMCIWEAKLQLSLSNRQKKHSCLLLLFVYSKASKIPIGPICWNSCNTRQVCLCLFQVFFIANKHILCLVNSKP